MKAVAVPLLGSEVALRYAKRDLATVEQALSLTPGRTACVQAGGCLGVFPKYLARYFETVYTFEPSPSLFPQLAANAPEANVVRLQAALGAAHALISTAQVRRGSKAGRYPHEGITHVSGPGVVPTLTIDDLALPICDLIVLDLEGYEARALLGARRTIPRCRPVLMVEVNDNCHHYGMTEDEVRALILGHGYRLVSRRHSDEIFVPEAV